MTAHAPVATRRVADVVVIGLGAAGATAAITAHDLGARVLVLEKAPRAERGGNSRVSGQIVFWPNDIEQAVGYLRAMAGPYGDRVDAALARAWAVEMHANRAWLAALGMRPVRVSSVEYPDLPGAGCVEVLLHGEGPYGEARLWDGVIAPAFDARAIETLYDTRAVELVRSGGAITGVIAERGGERLQVDALRAVVLTCGGFENDAALVRTYCTDLAHCHPLGTPWNTGDGIRMAMAVGADLWHMNNLAGPVLGFLPPGQAVATRLGPPGAHGYLYVGADGTRFVAEAPSFRVEGGRQHSPIKHGKILRHGRWMQYPCPAPMHMIFDESVRRGGALFGRTAGYAFGWEAIHSGCHTWSADNLAEIERGWIARHDSLAGLARAIGVCPQTLTATVDRYQASCRAGGDADFGRDPATLVPLAGPPWYTIELVPVMLNTQGGPVRNERAQVIHVSGRPIPRLYSAGELGSLYAWRYQAGANLGECFAFGRIAGRHAASEVPRT